MREDFLVDVAQHLGFLASSLFLERGALKSPKAQLLFSVEIKCKVRRDRFVCSKQNFTNSVRSLDCTLNHETICIVT